MHHALDLPKGTIFELDRENWEAAFVGVGGDGARKWLEEQGAFNSYEDAERVATNALNADSVKQLYVSAGLHLSNIQSKGGTPLSKPAAASGDQAAPSGGGPTTPSGPSPPPHGGKATMAAEHPLVARIICALPSWPTR